MGLWFIFQANRSALYKESVLPPAHANAELEGLTEAKKVREGRKEYGS